MKWWWSHLGNDVGYIYSIKNSLDKREKYLWLFNNDNYFDNDVDYFISRGRTPDYYKKTGPVNAAAVARIKDSFIIGSDGPETKV